MCIQSACIWGCMVKLVALVWLFSTVSFHMGPQITWVSACEITLIAPVWLFHCAFSNYSSMNLDQRMQSHTGCICLIFLHCAFSNVSSNGQHEKMHNRTSHICLIIPCALKNLKRKFRSDVKLLQRKRKWKRNWYKIQQEFVLFGRIYRKFESYQTSNKVWKTFSKLPQNTYKLIFRFDLIFVSEFLSCGYL